MIALPNWPDDFLFIYLFFPGVADVFLPFLQVVPQVTNVFPWVFPIALDFKPICFAQSPPLLTFIGGPKGEAPHLSIESSIFCEPL